MARSLEPEEDGTPIAELLQKLEWGMRVQVNYIQKRVHLKIQTYTYRRIKTHPQAARR